MASKAKSKDPVKKPAKKRANGYEAPKKLPLDSVIADLYKNQWKIGPSIGSGGFGEIYSARRADSAIKKHADYPNVVKIEPHGNGPLFVEMHFYMRVGKLAEIESFKKTRGLKSFGMPIFVSNGSHELEGVKHRFIVMERYGKDIWQTFLDQGRKFPEHTIYRLALQIIYVLEYIHSQTYVHADIKGANILTGFGKDADKQVYLVDFGLASHYTSKDFKPDPKKMHNGTIEYTSRDAHHGVPTMRGDLEILAYNLIQWHCGFLPWEKQNLLNNPVKVQEAKEDCMKNVDKFMKTCFDKNIPAPIHNFVKYVSQLKYDESPDYLKTRKMFEQGLKSLGKTDSGPLEFGKAIVNGKQQKDTINKTKRASSSILGDDVIASSENKSPVKRPRNRKVIPEEVDSSPEKKSPVKRSRNKKVVPEEVESSPEVVPPKKSRKKAEPEQEPEPSTSKFKKPATLTTSKSGTITLNAESSSKKKKKIEVNLELDISIDADVVINLHRRDKKKEKGEDKDKKEKGEDKDKKEKGEDKDKKEKEKEKEEKPKPTQKPKAPPIDDSIEEISASDEEEESRFGRNKTNRFSPRRLKLMNNRAGEYKGKKAKPT